MRPLVIGNRGLAPFKKLKKRFKIIDVNDSSLFNINESKKLVNVTIKALNRKKRIKRKIVLMPFDKDILMPNGQWVGTKTFYERHRLKGMCERVNEIIGEIRKLSTKEVCVLLPTPKLRSLNHPKSDQFYNSVLNILYENTIKNKMIKVVNPMTFIPPYQIRGMYSGDWMREWMKQNTF